MSVTVLYALQALIECGLCVCVCVCVCVSVCVCVCVCVDSFMCQWACFDLKQMETWMLKSHVVIGYKSIFETF